MVRVAVHVEGGMVQAVYATSEDVDIEVYDLDVSSYPDEGEEDAADSKRRHLEEIKGSLDWSCIW